jgi:thiamine pyrophosphate-dependent acetolactate synthase large subunit-like protein
MPDSKTMPLVKCLEALNGVRNDDVVVTTMGAAREWMPLSSHPLDFNYVPSSMGQATSLGLGLALARPDCRVVVCNGDGCMLMNLGSLVTITAQAPENLTILIFDNGVYEVTGAQATPATRAARRSGDRVDLAAIARAAGFRAVHEFDDLEHWQAEVRNIIDEPGPTFALLKVAPIPGAGTPRSPGPAPPRAKAFKEALAERGK